MKESNSSVRIQCTNYTKKTETHYLEDTASVENGKKNLNDVLQNWWVPFFPIIIIPIILYNFLFIIYVLFILQFAKGTNGITTME